MSTSPGQTTAPVTSMTSTPGRFRSSTGTACPRPAIPPASIQTSWTRSIPRVGSRTLPPRRHSGFDMAPFGSRGWRFPARLRGRFPPGEEVEDGHPDGDAVGDLLQNHTVHSVRDVLGDLDAPVHGAGVHDGDVRLRAPEPLRVHTVNA